MQAEEEIGAEENNTETDNTASSVVRELRTQYDEQVERMEQAFEDHRRAHNTNVIRNYRRLGELLSNGASPEAAVDTTAVVAQTAATEEAETTEGTEVKGTIENKYSPLISRKRRGHFNDQFYGPGATLAQVSLNPSSEANEAQTSAMPAALTHPASASTDRIAVPVVVSRSYSPSPRFFRTRKSARFGNRGTARGLIHQL